MLESRKSVEFRVGLPHRLQQPAPFSQPPMVSRLRSHLCVIEVEYPLVFLFGGEAEQEEILGAEKQKDGTSNCLIDGLNWKN